MLAGSIDENSELVETDPDNILSEIMVSRSDIFIHSHFIAFCQLHNVYKKKKKQILHRLMSLLGSVFFSVL